MNRPVRETRSSVRLERRAAELPAGVISINRVELFPRQSRAHFARPLVWPQSSPANSRLAYRATGIARPTNWSERARDLKLRETGRAIAQCETGTLMD